jgi:signal transduction histidine kinase
MARFRAYRAAMQFLYVVIAVIFGVAVGWFSARRLRRMGPTEDSGHSAAALDADSSWLVDARVLFEEMPVMIVTVDDGDRIVHINGMGKQELPMLSLGDTPSRWSAPLAEIVQHVRSGLGLGLLETIVLGDPPRSLRVSAARYAKGVAILLVDVTEDVDFEEARRTFSAAVSHELRTPLARILGLAETLALPDVEDERDELVMQIENEVDGMRRLIDEMLLLAALDRGRLAVADGIVDACAVAAIVVDDARQRRLGRGREITLAAFGEVDVPVAARLYEVVIQNLVDNALIHGGPDARVDVVVVAERDVALITVSDTGTGISAQHLPFVFQRFYRGDAARSGPGSGLGLALVKHIVEAHGGSVVAESDGTSGATVRVQLPLAT